MTVGEMKKELDKFADDLPVCVPDSNEDYLYPTLCKGVVGIEGDWCDDMTPNYDGRADHNSEYVEIVW